MSLSRKSSGGLEARTASKEVTVINKLGVHARPAAMFVKTANRFVSEITVERDGEQVDGKSIMGLMMLAAGQGSQLIITAQGSDAELAVRELELLFQRKFDEE
jgi:phosphocarrier protein HPr